MLILRFLYDVLYRCLQNNIAELLICIPAYVEELKKQGNATYVFLPFFGPQDFEKPSIY